MLWLRALRTTNPSRNPQPSHRNVNIVTSEAAASPRVRRVGRWQKDGRKTDGVKEMPVATEKKSGFKERELSGKTTGWILNP
jgi:hypothetical protein